MGTVMSALPAVPASLIDPVTNNPISTGVPNRCCTTALCCASLKVSCETSEFLIMLKAKNKIALRNPVKSAMIVRQPTGANHFQFRDHQPRCGGGCSGGAGG